MPLKATPAIVACCCGCGVVVSDPQALEAHQERCKAVAFCPGCDQHFPKQRFQAHLKEHSCEAASCAVCGVVFSCVEELSDHCQQDHQGRGLAAISRRLHDLAQLSKPLAFKCSTLLTSTGARLSALAATNAECRTATTETPRGGGETPRRSGSTVPCPGCARGFQGRELLAAHLGTPVAGRRPPCPAEACTGCGTPFADKEMRIAHEETCGRVARCPGCPLRFGSEALLRSHVSTGRSRRACSACLCRGCFTVLGDDAARAVHEASCSAAASCPGCRRCFGAKEDLAAHISKPARTRPKCPAAPCVGCGEAFASAAQVAAHEVACWRVLACPGCSGRFGSSACFQAHLKDPSSYACSAAQCATCGMVFGSPEECGDHSESHRGAGPGFRRRASAAAKGLVASGGASGQTSGGGSAGGGGRAPPVGGPSREGPSPRRRGGAAPQSEGVWQDAAGRALAVAVDDVKGPALEMIMQEVASELEALDSDPLRRRLRQLQLQWHPDRACRCGVRAADACRVFQLVQGVWESRVIAAPSAAHFGGKV
mmetsp:Transcript_27395/g.91046  ORF Transcript_27395/g.91046 Transcript_27395/m.91046 type:complete len:542 (+) Transcript_27395:89-1714(+)